jgi:hypothetical protein
MMPKNTNTRAALSVLALVMIAAIRPSSAGAEETDLELLRVRALQDIFVLRDFRAGKNSFVESPERHVGAWTDIGYRHTILDVQGQGSLRHIWTTRGEGEPFLDWEFYVDGEPRPSIRGTDLELVNASRDFPVPVAPVNHLPINNRAFNFYLPVPFEQSLRIDVVQRAPSFWLWFCQLDYRLNDDSLKGVRLFSQRTGNDLSLAYVGLPNQQLERPPSTLPRTTHDLAATTVKPGQQAVVARLSGPAIVRELRLRWPDDASLRLRVRYDDAATFAVDSPVDRFFGPFRGVSYFLHATGDASCYLPMPFRRNLELVLANEGDSDVEVAGTVILENVPGFSPSWGYFHALHQHTERTNGHRPHQVLYARGRGHWLGMTLYNTGHDHGGGDFAVIDAEGDKPSFLHGINGEDYFTFAWFGKGGHHPYAVAHTNEEGRYRHHFENVYPFSKSIAIEWGAFADVSPESVAVWYQDSPEDTTLPDGARAESAEWDVFGPVAIPHDETGRATAERFSVLPSVEDLDAGKEFECRLVKETFTSGWQKEWTVGAMLNLTYIARHGTKVDPESELGGMGHAFLARRFVTTDSAQDVPCLFAHDDPAEVWVNGRRVYQGPQQLNGFETTTIDLPLREGKNEIVVRLTNYFNRNFNWTGFLLRPIDGTQWN